MLISCPVCKTRFRLNEQKISSAGVRLRCSKCSAVFRLAADSEVRPGHLTVVIAHESKEFCNAVRKVLAPEPFTIISTHDGKEALDITLKLVPDVVLLNVALPTLYGFQVCEALRNDPRTSGIKIILLAAIYDKTKYKRSPQTLYGADDYIEQHHIPDALAAMIYRLAAEAKPLTPGQDESSSVEKVIATSPDRLTADEAVNQEKARKELRDHHLYDVVHDDQNRDESARQLARSIVSDISLYREVELEEGLKNGNLEQHLGNEIRDGRALYESRLPAVDKPGVDYFGMALNELIEQKKRELGIR
jgi:predicted Zn finger-like uncharacterized protein